MQAEQGLGQQLRATARLQLCVELGNAVGHQQAQQIEPRQRRFLGAGRQQAAGITAGPRRVTQGAGTGHGGQVSRRLNCLLCHTLAPPPRQGNAAEVPCL